MTKIEKAKIQTEIEETLNLAIKELLVITEGKTNLCWLKKDYEKAKRILLKYGAREECDGQIHKGTAGDVMQACEESIENIEKGLNGRRRFVWLVYVLCRKLDVGFYKDCGSLNKLDYREKPKNTLDYEALRFKYLKMDMLKVSAYDIRKIRGFLFEFLGKFEKETNEEIIADINVIVDEYLAYLPE